LQYFDQFSPIGYVVADARNICVEYSIAQKFEWTLFIDHDTVIPPTTFLLLGEWMRAMTHPIVGGLYYCKGSHPEPLVFRGRGTGYYDRWKFGDAVEVDALPMGCTLIHNSILKHLYDNSEVYTVGSIYGPIVVRRVFQTPKISWQDPENGRYNSYAATEDLPLFDRIMKDKVLEKLGWKKLAKKQYPFICDTRIFCQHIDEAGIQYPGQMYKNTKQYTGSDLQKIERKGVFNVGQSKGSQYSGA
jgi:hypothetical protein